MGKSLFRDGPLDPMPSASPQLIGAWLGRLSLGCATAISGFILSLALLVLLSCIPSTGAGVRVILFPIVTLLGGIAIWMLTTGEPGKEKRLKSLRWISRAAALCIIPIVLLTYVVRNWSGFSWTTEKTASVLYNIVQLGWGIGAVFFMQYLALLSSRLGDKVLWRIFLTLKWILAILLGFAVAEVVFGGLPYRLPQPADPAITQAGAITTIFFIGAAVIYLSCLYVMWRLNRRLLFATGQLVNAVLQREGQACE